MFTQQVTFFINCTPCGICRSSLFLSYWLLSSLCRGSVQNLSCDLEQSEGFPTSGNDTGNKYSISDALRSLPQGSSLSSLSLYLFLFFSICFSPPVVKNKQIKKNTRFLHAGICRGRLPLIPHQFSIRQFCQ